MSRTRRPPPASLRLVTYNVLLGARRREDLVTNLLKRVDADVIALQEVSDHSLIGLLERRLGMTACLGPPSDSSALQVVVLSRLPIRRVQNHRHPGVMLRSHLEVELETPICGGSSIQVHCLHLAARFGERNNGEARRMSELAVVLERIASAESMPHIITGDFNALAPADSVAATAFFQRMAQLRRAGLLVRRGNGLVGPRLGSHEDAELDAAWRSVGIDPRLDVGIPLLPRIVGPLTGRLPRSERLDTIFTRRLRRHSIEHLLDLGYTDCFRKMHPRAHGFTCATWMPAARIDYIFATAELARLVSACEVVGGRRWPDPAASIASDHFPLVSEFRSASPSRRRAPHTG